MLNTLKRLVVEEKGQGMAEYGLILAGIAVIVIAVMAIFRDKVTALFNGISF